MEATPEWHGREALRHERRRYVLGKKEKLRQRNKARYLTPEARAKTYASLKNWAHENPERYAEIRNAAQFRFRLRKFGLTLAQYEAMLAAQNHLCAICEGPNCQRSGTQGGRDKGCGWPTTKRAGFTEWHIDHDHDTKQVRNLLCSNCNIALGAAKDDPDLLLKMAAYLRRHKGG